MEQRFTQYDWAIQRASVQSWEEQEEQIINNLDEAEEGRTK